jgi:hypothetical protein
MTASCRRSRFERLVRTMSVYVVAAMPLCETPADGAELPAHHCALERAPVLDWLRLAKGDDCPFDEDGNGLHDGVEAALARCFVPEISFDSDENALRPDEPHVVFSADPIGLNVIRLHFVVLFARDGGYVLGTRFPCLSDEHNGDAQAVTVDVAWLERDRRWIGAPIAMHSLGPRGVDERTGLTGRVSDVLSGTHPRLYATAGKHHWLHRPASLDYACNCGPLGQCGSVRDRADGAGVRVVPTRLRHAPRFALRDPASSGPTDDAATHARVRPLAPLDAGEHDFRNACEYRSRGRLTPAARSLGSNDLADLGYPGERVFGACFRGGLGGPCLSTVSVGEALAWDNHPGKVAPRFELGPGKLIGTLLGIVGRHPTPDLGPSQVLRWSGSRFDIGPGAVTGWGAIVRSPSGRSILR